MPFPFTCPSCRLPSQVPDELAGTRAKCPACGVVALIPAPGVAEVPVVAPVEPVAAVPVVGSAGPANMSSRPARKASSGGAATILAFLVIGGFLALFCCGGSGGLIWLYSRSSGPDETPLASRPATIPTERATIRSGPAGSPKAAPLSKQLVKATPWLITGDGRKAPIGSAAVVHRELRLMLTNYHVVQKFEKLLVMFPAFGTGTEPITRPNYYFDKAAEKGQRARVVASDPSRDLALLQIDRLPDDVEVLALAADSAVAGQSVHTVGAAERIIGFGEEEGVLWRYASARVRRVVQREHRYSDGQRVNARVIELPAGNDRNDYGGPIVDDNGRLLGVTCDFNVGRNQATFAIDVREVKALLENHFTSIGRRWPDGGSSTSPAPPLDEDNELPSYWVQVLRQPNEQNVQKARERLIAMGRAAVLELRKALRDQDSRLRLAAISILGAIGENATAAIDDLAKALGDSDSAIRAAAAAALGQIGKAAHTALGPLIQATGDPDAAVREAADASVSLIGAPERDDVAKLSALWKEPSAEKRELYLAALQKVKPAPEIAAEMFVPLVNDAEKKIRLRAIQLIGEAGPKGHGAAFNKLLPRADDAEAEVRRAALAALEKLGPATPAERRELEAGLRGQYPELRQFCVGQLCNLGESAQGSVPDIARLLRDTDPKVRAAAARTLGRIGTPALSVLDELHSARLEKDAGVRQAAVEALGRFGRERGVLPALFDAFNDESREVREAAAKSLKGLQPPLGADDQAQLRTALKSKQVEARRFAAAELARLGAEAASSLGDIVESLKDADLEVKRHLFAALAAHGNRAKEAVPAVLETMSTILQTDGRREGSLELFRQASITLSKIGDPVEAIAVWSKGLKTNNRAVRKEVVQSLGEVGPPARKAAKELCGLLDDPELAPAVGETLLKLGGEEVVRALSDVVDDNPSLKAKLAAVRILGKMGPDAKDAFQALYKCSTRYRGKEVGEAALESLKLIQKK